MNINSRIKKLEQTCYNSYTENDKKAPTFLLDQIEKGVYFDELTEEEQEAYKEYVGLSQVQLEQALCEDENINHFKLVRPYQAHPLKDKRKERERIEGIIKELEETFSKHPNDKNTT